MEEELETIGVTDTNNANGLKSYVLAILNQVRIFFNFSIIIYGVFSCIELFPLFKSMSSYAYSVLNLNVFSASLIYSLLLVLLFQYLHKKFSLIYTNYHETIDDKLHLLECDIDEDEILIKKNDLVTLLVHVKKQSYLNGMKNILLIILLCIASLFLGLHLYQVFSAIFVIILAITVSHSQIQLEDYTMAISVSALSFSSSSGNWVMLFFVFVPMFFVRRIKKREVDSVYLLLTDALFMFFLAKIFRLF